MKLSTQRWIDRWIGVPICRLLSLFKSKNRFRSAEETVQRILIILLSELGSLILSYPMVQKLKLKYPGAEIHFLVFSQNAEALSLLNVVPEKNIFSIRSSSLTALLKDSLLNVLRIRNRRMDVVIDCELFSRISSILAFLTGAPVIAGFHPHKQEGLYRGSYINRPVLYNPYLHISRQFMNLADAIESESMPPGKSRISPGQLTLPFVPLPKSMTESFQRRLFKDFPGILSRKLILIYPGGGQLPIRAWPISHYVDLSKRLMEKGFHIGIIGLPDDKGLAETLLSNLNSQKIFNLTGYTKTLKELLVLFNSASLLITNDGGPCHIAALIDLPAIVLYGPETPILYGSLNPKAQHIYANISCSPCLSAYNHRHSPCDGNNVCLQWISPEEIFRRAMDLMQQNGNTSP